MDGIKLLARNGEAVRQALELGEIIHMETASEELTDEFLLFAIRSGLLKQWAEEFPDPRQWCEISISVIIAACLAARFAGLYSLRKTGYVLRSARVLGELGHAVEVIEAGAGLSSRGTRDDALMSGDAIRKLLIKMEREAEVAPQVGQRRAAGDRTRLSAAEERRVAVAEADVATLQRDRLVRADGGAEL